MNECEHVIVLDVCCTIKQIKRPTTKCLAKKKKKKSKLVDVRTQLVLCVHHIKEAENFAKMRPLLSSCYISYNVLLQHRW